MKLLPMIKRALVVLAISTLAPGALGFVQEVHAGAVVVNPPVTLLPAVQAVQEKHTQVNCVYHPEGYKTCSYSITYTVGVTGYGFASGGAVIVYVVNAQTGATRSIQNTTASILPAGSIALDTGRSWCTAHGWLVKAYDVTRQRFSNIVAIGSCVNP